VDAEIPAVFAVLPSPPPGARDAAGPEFAGALAALDTYRKTPRDGGLRPDAGDPLPD
jgi:hypothetical protein